MFFYYIFLYITSEYYDENTYTDTWNILKELLDKVKAYKRDHPLLFPKNRSKDVNNDENNEYQYYNENKKKKIYSPYDLRKRK